MMKSANLKKTVCFIAATIDFILFAVKLYMAVSTNSISLYVDSLNSLADTFVCIFAFIGFIISCINPNEKYPFGYGKSEELINLLLSSVILITGLTFVYSSLQRLMYPVPVWYSEKYALTILVTAAVKLVMGIIFKNVNKNENSEIIKNLSTDSYLDFFMSFCIFISFTLTSKFGYAIDSVAGLIASAVIITSGIHSFIKCSRTIIGEKDTFACEQVKSIIERENIRILSIHCHSYGPRKIIVAEVTLEDSLLNEALKTINSLKDKIKNQFGYDLFLTVGGVYNEYKN